MKGRAVRGGWGVQIGEGANFIAICSAFEFRLRRALSMEMGGVVQMLCLQHSLGFCLSCRKGRNTRIYSVFCLRTVHKAVFVGRKRHEALNRYLGAVRIRLVRGSNVRFVWVSYIDFLAGA